MRHFASHAGFAGALEALIECGAYVHSVDKAGGAMLPWGAKHGVQQKKTAPSKTANPLASLVVSRTFDAGKR